jgi:hypothetical protein
MTERGRAEGKGSAIWCKRRGTSRKRLTGHDKRLVLEETERRSREAGKEALVAYIGNEKDAADGEHRNEWRVAVASDGARREREGEEELRCNDRR